MRTLMRFALYLFVAIGAIPIVVFLAFGPGLALPYVVFTWPGETALLMVNWTKGSTYTPDIFGACLLSAFFWFLIAFAVDLTVTVRRLPRAGS